MTTPALFDIQARTAPSEAPRCRMCPRPSRWVMTANGGEWGMYCAGRACSNRERLCQACGDLFEMGHGGAGTKYCSTACKHTGYSQGKSRPARARTPCAWCGRPQDRRHTGGLWPWICQPCLGPIRHVLGRLKEHRVPHEMARRLLADPGCQVCGQDILTLVPAATTGRLRAPMVVDHDHGCCPGVKSCGRCVRGFLCGNCNSAAGMLRDDPAIARSIADYLANTKGDEQ